MTIHSTHPFADAEPDPVRRLRGRLGGAVSLWTAGEGRDREGLTVTSLLLAHGEPAHVLGLLDPDSDLAERLLETEKAVVQLLSWPDRDLAEAFAGTAPAPGGPFRMGDFEQTTWGPRLTSVTAWCGVRLVETREVGWSVETTCRIDEIEVGDEVAPLLHRRGRFLRLDV